MISFPVWDSIQNEHGYEKKMVKGGGHHGENEGHLQIHPSLSISYLTFYVYWFSTTLIFFLYNLYTQHNLMPIFKLFWSLFS